METTDHSVANAASLALTTDGFKEKLSLVEQITREIFSGDVRVDRIEDPEIEGEVYFAFRIATTLDLKTIAERRNEWYDRTRKAIADDCQFIRLAVDVAR